MIKIFHGKKLLHIIHRRGDFSPGRKELISPDNFLQCAVLCMGTGKTFIPHVHNWNRWAGDKIAQESWVVISGRVAVTYYDRGGLNLGVYELSPGDASFTLEGGHNYEALEDGTLVYEFKTGPYQGQTHDKTFI